MLFTTNHEEARSNFEPVENGEYEAVISEVELKTGSNAFNSGSEGLKLVLTIRDDVDQPFQKRKLFENLVRSPKAMFKFQQVAKGVGLPDGVGVSSLEEFRELILYKPVRITVKQKKEMYQGEPVVRENVVAYEVSELEYAGGASNADPFANGGTIDISDDDLPF